MIRVVVAASWTQSLRSCTISKPSTAIFHQTGEFEITLPSNGARHMSTIVRNAWNDARPIKDMVLHGTTPFFSARFSVKVSERE